MFGIEASLPAKKALKLFKEQKVKKIKESKIFIDPNLLLAQVSMKKYKR